MRDHGGSDDNPIDDDTYSPSYYSSYSGSRSASRGLAQHGQGTLDSRAIARIRSRLKGREITERRQVGDAESMMNEPAALRPGGGSEWLE